MSIWPGEDSCHALSKSLYSRRTSALSIMKKVFIIRIYLICTMRQNIFYFNLETYIVVYGYLNIFSDIRCGFKRICQFVLNHGKSCK